MSEYNKAIICITHAIVINNAGGVARALMDAGYEQKSYLNDCEMELALLQTFLCDKKKYFELMNSIPWSTGDKKTNAPEIKDKLIEITNMQDTPETKGDWWKHILILLNTPQP